MISTSKYKSDGPMTWIETVFVFCVIRISVIGVKIREVTAKNMKSVRNMTMPSFARFDLINKQLITKTLMRQYMNTKKTSIDCLLSV